MRLRLKREKLTIFTVQTRRAISSRFHVDDNAGMLASEMHHVFLDEFSGETAMERGKRAFHHFLPHKAAGTVLLAEA